MQFVGQSFTDLCHLVDILVCYEKVADEESQNRISTRGTYYKSQNQLANFIEFDEENQDDNIEDNGYDCSAAEIINQKPFACDVLRKPSSE